MIVVSNTSPLNYLILIRAIDILPKIFDRVVVPQTVARELSHSKAPRSVRVWIANPPAWLEVRAPTDPDLSLRLHPGERDALALAAEINANLVLVDERVARRVAVERGLTVTGTLGILELGADRGLLELQPAVEALCNTNFHIEKGVLESLIENQVRRQGDRRQDRERGSGG